MWVLRLYAERHRCPDFGEPFGRPIRFVVQHGPLAIQSEPNSEAPPVGWVSAQDMVVGWPMGAWLELMPLGRPTPTDQTQWTWPDGGHFDRRFVRIYELGPCYFEEPEGADRIEYLAPCAVVTHKRHPMDPMREEAEHDDTLYLFTLHRTPEGLLFYHNAQWGSLWEHELPLRARTRPAARCSVGSGDDENGDGHDADVDDGDDGDDGDGGCSGCYGGHDDDHGGDDYGDDDDDEMRESD